MALIHCKECGNEVNSEEYKCPHCKTLFRCNKCGKEVSSKDNTCPHCGEKLKVKKGFFEIIKTIIKIIIQFT